MAKTIKVPEESLPNIIDMLTEEIKRLNDRLKEMTDRNSKQQYRISELSNQIDALKQENRRLYGIIEHADDHIETDCEDF